MPSRRASSGKKTDLKAIAKQAGLDEDTLKKAIDLINAGENLSVIIGPTVFEYSDNTELLDAIFQLAKRKNTNFRAPLPWHQCARGR